MDVQGETPAPEMETVNGKKGKTATTPKDLKKKQL